MDDLSYEIPAMVEQFKRRALIVAAYLAAVITLVVLGHAL
jgi:hypothetical protein